MKTYRNAERTKRWIRRTFTEMMAEKRDIEKITVTELARRADISKTTFYYHYDDIYAVAEEFENELIEQLSAVLSEISRGGFSVPFDTVIEVILEAVEKLKPKKTPSAD